jgi:transcriptional regulator GlxA family with amidase domain
MYRDLKLGGLADLEIEKPIQLRLDSKTYTALIDLCTKLEREIREKEDGWEEMTLAQLLEMTVLLKRQRIAAATAGANAGMQGLQTISQLVQQSMAYVSLHVDEDLSLSSMAARVNLSEEHLTRSFRKEIGLSFHQFVLAARIDRGRQLLAEAPELSVLEVALQSGFSTLAHFSSTFKSVTGENPTRFRARMIDSKKPAPD